MNDHKVFDLGNLALQGDMTLPGAQLTYQTYGKLAADKANVVLYPTSYGAHHTDIEWLIGPGKILDSGKYFIVIPNMLGNGLSSSPSNMAEPYGLGRFPSFSHWDNVQAQRRMLVEVFSIDRLALVYGWSMGAQQALHWGAIFPDKVRRPVRCLRLRPHLAPQQGLPGRGPRHPDRRPGLGGGRLHRPTCSGPARHG